MIQFLEGISYLEKMQGKFGGIFGYSFGCKSRSNGIDIMKILSAYCKVFEYLMGQNFVGQNF